MAVLADDLWASAAPQRRVQMAKRILPSRARAASARPPCAAATALRAADMIPHPRALLRPRALAGGLARPAAGARARAGGAQLWLTGGRLYYSIRSTGGHARVILPCSAAWRRRRGRRGDVCRSPGADGSVSSGGAFPRSGDSTDLEDSAPRRYAHVLTLAAGHAVVGSKASPSEDGDNTAGFALRKTPHPAGQGVRLAHPSSSTSCAHP